jgi:hypothetical protein
MKSIFTPRAHARPFRRCLWGYDRAQVDQFLHRTAADRQRLQEDLAQLDALRAISGQNGIRATIEAARLEARTIHDTAQEEAARLLREAADHTRALQRERIEISQRESDRQATLRWEVASCLETSIAALRTATERLSESDGARTEVEEPAPGIATASTTWTLSSLRSAWTSRRRVHVVLAVVAAGASLLAYRSGAREIPARRMMAPIQHAAESTTASIVSSSIEPDPVLRDASPSGTERAPTASGSLAAPPDGLVLTLTARRSCWIGTSIDGSQRLERLLKADETIMLRAHDETVLRVGDAAALSVLINNQVTKPLGSDGEVVTRRITRSNFPSFLEKDLAPQPRPQLSAPR